MSPVERRFCVSLALQSDHYPHSATAGVPAQGPNSVPKVPNFDILRPVLLPTEAIGPLLEGTTVPAKGLQNV